jgi:hypothetical protein
MLFGSITGGIPGTTLTLDGELLLVVDDKAAVDDPEPAVAPFFEPLLLHAAASSAVTNTTGTGTRRTEKELMIDRRG